MSNSDLYDAGVIYIPKDFTLNNYQYAFEKVGYFSALIKTVLAIAGTALLQVASSPLVVFGFARFEFNF